MVIFYVMFPRWDVCLSNCKGTSGFWPCAHPNSVRQGLLSFHCDKLHPTEIHRILLSYTAPSWALLHPNELHCTLLSYDVSSKLCCISLSYAAPSELSCTLLSYAAPLWATLYPIWAKLLPKSYAAPSELSCALLIYAAPFLATLHPSDLLSYASP
jgi:hypothetical protein